MLSTEHALAHCSCMKIRPTQFNVLKHAICSWCLGFYYKTQNTYYTEPIQSLRLCCIYFSSLEWYIGHFQILVFDTWKLKECDLKDTGLVPIKTYFSSTGQRDLNMGKNILSFMCQKYTKLLSHRFTSWYKFLKILHWFLYCFT